MPQECARPRAQQRGKQGAAVIFLSTQTIPGLLRPGRPHSAGSSVKTRPAGQGS